MQNHLGILLCYKSYSKTNYFNTKHSNDHKGSMRYLFDYWRMYEKNKRHTWYGNNILKHTGAAIYFLDVNKKEKKQSILPRI